MLSRSSVANVNPDWQMQVYPTGQVGRETIEQFIAVRYAADFKAHLNSFYPHLLGVKHKDGRIVAALGYRHAEESPLFLEQYLELPIEARLSDEVGYPVRREGMLEIGNLASDFSGGNRVLISTLTAYLYGKSARWVVFTGTRALLNSFRRFSIDVIELGSASPEQLTSQDMDWGTYYHNQPKVAAVNVSQAYWAILGHMATPEQGIWAQALQRGREYWEGVSGLDSGVVIGLQPA